MSFLSSNLREDGTAEIKKDRTLFREKIREGRIGIISIFGCIQVTIMIIIMITIIALSLLYHCFIIALSLLYHCFIIALSLLYHCFIIAFISILKLHILCAFYEYFD